MSSRKGLLSVCRKTQDSFHIFIHNERNTAVRTIVESYDFVLEIGSNCIGQKAKHSNVDYLSVGKFCSDSSFDMKVNIMPITR